jgi:TonB family protein
LGALAWATGAFVRVAVRVEPPVFVTLLAGEEMARPGTTAGAAAPPVIEALAAPPAAPAAAPPPRPTPVARRPAAPVARPTQPAPRRASAAPVAPAAPSPGEPEAAEASGPGAATASVRDGAGSPPGADASRVYGEGEVDRVAAPLGGIRRPEYPPRERTMGREGRVSLVVTVDDAGVVRKVSVTRSAGAAFDASARRAVEGTPFRAARKADRAVASTVTVNVSFELD